MDFARPAGLFCFAVRYRQVVTGVEPVAMLFQGMQIVA